MIANLNRQDFLLHSNWSPARTILTYPDGSECGLIVPVPAQHGLNYEATVHGVKKTFLSLKAAEYWAVSSAHEYQAALILKAKVEAANA